MKRVLHAWWPLSIRVQLMLWYTMVFAVLLFFSGVFLYRHLETSLADSLDASLQVRAQQIAGGIVDRNGTVTIHDVTGELPGFDTHPSDQQVPHADVNFGILVRLLDARGQPFHATPAFGALQVPLISVMQPLHGTPWQGTVTTNDGQEVRLYSRALDEHGTPFAVIQVGQSLTGLHYTVRHIIEELLVLGLFVVGVSALGSYVLAARAFSPIHRLTQTARSIKAGDLHQRVPVPRTHDEVHFLAVTLNEMIERLDEMFTRQRRFVADASHELRTPVAVIRSKTDVALLQDVEQQEYITVLRDINAESERLGHLINDLLALARGDEGQTRFEHELVRLDLLAQMVAANAEVLAAERGVALFVRAQEAVSVFGDEARLIQVIMNLLDNAIQYTHVGGRVRLIVEAKQHTASLSIQDTGIGIQAQHLPHLFERFYRVDPAHTRTAGGSSGLGLAIVEWVVRAHGGSVAVESVVGQGSCFTVTLPLAPASSAWKALTTGKRHAMT